MRRKGNWARVGGRRVPQAHHLIILESLLSCCLNDFFLGGGLPLDLKFHPSSFSPPGPTSLFSFFVKH